MDTLTFLAKALESLAWPTCVLVVVFLLRQELRRALTLLKKLKAGPVEAEFELEVMQLRDEAETALLGTLAAPESPERTKLMQLAQVSTRSAIIEAWRLVEFAAADLSKQGKLRVFFENGGVSQAPGQVTVFSELRALRNRAAHDHKFEPSYEAAFGYIETALRLRSAIIAEPKNG